LKAEGGCKINSDPTPAVENLGQLLSLFSFIIFFSFLLFFKKKKRPSDSALLIRPFVSTPKTCEDQRDARLPPYSMIYLPPRKFLLLGFVLGLLLLVEFVNVRGRHPVTGLSEKALSSLCNSAHIQRLFPPPKRLSDEDFDSGTYSAGSRDSWSDENEDSIHWSQEDENTQWEYEKSARMINAAKLLKGNATSQFRGMSSS
jgi:hypothetical protein